jgi:hypothetical protein
LPPANKKPSQTRWLGSLSFWLMKPACARLALRP